MKGVTIMTKKRTTRTMRRRRNFMINRAIREHMTLIEIININNYSRKAIGLQYCNPMAEHDPFVFELEGSPADIRKGIKHVEKLGIEPLYYDYPILREGRRYSLTAKEGAWSVARIDRIDENSVKAPIIHHEILETEINEPEAIQASSF